MSRRGSDDDFSLDVAVENSRLCPDWHEIIEPDGKHEERARAMSAAEFDELGGFECKAKS